MNQSLYPNGASYMITEQGDLGLGLTPINEQQASTIKRNNAQAVSEEKPLTDAEKKLY